MKIEKSKNQLKNSLYSYVCQPTNNESSEEGQEEPVCVLTYREILCSLICYYSKERLYVHLLAWTR